MKERILKTLKAYLTNNKDVLSEKEIKDLEEQIAYMEKKIRFLKWFKR